MKNIKSLASIGIFSLVFCTINSCIDDQGKFEFIAHPPSEEIAFTNTFLSEYVLTNQTIDNIAERFIWNVPSFGVETPVNYELQGAPTGSFDEVTVLGNTNQNHFGVTVTQMIALAAKAGLDNDPENNEIIDGEAVPNNTGAIYFRIKASVGSQATLESVSEPQPLNVFLPEPEPDAEPVIPMIAVPGNHQAWAPDKAPLLAASGLAKTDYEGYIWLDGEYKLVAPDGDGAFKWGNLDWGDDGSFTGLLLADGEVNCKAATGNYFLQVNTADLTYTATAYNWGVIGSSTTGGWDSDTDMTYDKDNKVWKVTTDLIVGELKFRANDAWDWNYGDEGGDLSLEIGTANIAVTEAGNYTIVLNLSTPRNYTYELIVN